MPRKSSKRSSKKTRVRKVALKDQAVKVDMLQSVEWLLEAGERVSNQDLARALDSSGGRPLCPKVLRQVVLVLRGAPEKHRRGRKPTPPARLDHLMTHVDRLYDQLSLRYSEEDEKKRSGRKPRRTSGEIELRGIERIYTEILRRMSNEFPNRDWTLLRNLHSKWRNRKEWEPPEGGNEHPDD